MIQKSKQPHQPIKRSPHIAGLSRDHHHGLLFCWKIRQGLKQKVNLERIRKYINFFWDTHMLEHFTQEEQVLFTRVSTTVSNRGNDEHEIIRLLILGINRHNKTNADSYARLANMVEEHIRYEERVLFPYLEANIEKQELELIGKELESHVVTEAYYPDEFWMRKKPVATS